MKPSFNLKERAKTAILGDISLKAAENLTDDYTFCIAAAGTEELIYN